MLFELCRSFVDLCFLGSAPNLGGTHTKTVDHHHYHHHHPILNATIILTAPHHNPLSRALPPAAAVDSKAHPSQLPGSLSNPRTLVPQATKSQTRPQARL